MVLKLVIVHLLHGSWLPYSKAWNGECVKSDDWSWDVKVIQIIEERHIPITMKATNLCSLVVSGGIFSLKEEATPISG